MGKDRYVKQARRFIRDYGYWIGQGLKPYEFKLANRPRLGRSQLYPSAKFINSYCRAARRCSGRLYAAKHGDPLQFVQTAMGANKRRR